MYVPVSARKSLVKCIDTSYKAFFIFGDYFLREIEKRATGNKIVLGFVNTEF